MPTDNLTTRVRQELERRGTIVSDSQIDSILQKRGINQFNVAETARPTADFRGGGRTPIFPLETVKSNSSILNAVGVGLWSAMDTALFGVPGAFVKEEDYLDFESTPAKYAAAVGGLAGFIGGAPIKIGAKAVGLVAKPFIRKAGFESLEAVAKGMMKRGVKEGVSKKQSKQIIGHYKKLAHKAQINKDFAKHFDEKATNLLVNYTDDAVRLGNITQKESIAIKRMFGDNYTKRPIQDFIGLMAERGIAKSNPVFARVAGHAMNDALMFGMIDTIFEGVSMIEDNHFDWTAPIWGAATGLAFSQIQWLNPVGKGSKWYPDFKQGLKAAFGGKSPYKKMTKDQLSAHAKFFGESLSNIEGGSKVVTFARGEKRLSTNIATGDLIKKLDDVFGEESKAVLSEYLESQRKVFGREMIKWATREGAENIGKNWMRMAFGGILFNTHTLGEMAISGYEPDINDILPHFLIGAFLQHGKNPSRFDLNSTRMNQLRNNLRTLGFETRQLTDIPSFNNVESRFTGGIHPEKNKETIRIFHEKTIGSDVSEFVEVPLREGDISVQVQGNTKFDRIYDKMKKQFKYMKSKDNISVDDAKEIVKQFETETGLKTINEYDRYFDELSVESTKGFEENLVDVIEKARLSDDAQEIGIVKGLDKSGKTQYQVPDSITIPKEIYDMAGRGELSFIKGADGEILSGVLAKEKLSEKLDAFGIISTTTSAIMQNTKRMPAGKQVREIKTLSTIEKIYREIEGAENEINDSFPNKMSYADSFTFVGSANDYIPILGRNVAIRSAQRITDIFDISPKTINRDELISYMNESGLISSVTGEKPLLRTSVDNINITFEEGTPDIKQQKRGPELKRSLRKILMLQSISGGYEKSQDVDRVNIDSQKAEELLGFLSKNGLDIESMPPWLHEDTMNFILRDKIGKSGLRVDEISAFMSITESGMSEFNTDMKSGVQGFKMSLIDENFVQHGYKDQAIEYNLWVRGLIKKSGGLIETAGKRKVINGNEINVLLDISKKGDENVSAQSRLLEFINALPTDTGFSNSLGQYVMEGGSRDVESWLISQGVIKYNKKSSNGWDVNMEAFTKDLEERLHTKIQREGFTPEYVKSMYENHEDAARAAYDSAYDVESSLRFGLNNFLEKYNFDGLDYAPESKEIKKKLMKELFLQEDFLDVESFEKTGIDEVGAPIGRVVDKVLERISIKKDGDWIKYSDIPKLEQLSFKKDIARDIVKLVPSQYTSIRVNSFKYEISRITEKETFQQQTRLSTLYKEWDLPYVVMERDAVSYDLYNGRVQRRFFDIFGESRDLPKLENESIGNHREILQRLITSKKSSFGLDHKDGMVLMQVSRDTSPIVIAKEHLEKIDKPYVEFADKILKNDNIGESVKGRIRRISDKMKDETQRPSDWDYNVALSQLTFADMLSGKKSIKKLEEFLNSEMNMDKAMGRIKLYDSKNFVKSDRNMLHSIMTLYKDSLGDMKSYDAVRKIFQQNGFGVAIWNDVKYATIDKEIKSVLKELKIEGKDWDLSNMVSDAHGKVSSFDSIAFVSRSMMRYGHAMMGNDPNSTNPFKPVIVSGGRSGPLLMGKTLFVYSEALDTFFKTNSDLDILLASSGAKMFNEGKTTKDGLDSSLINQSYNRINTERKIGSQKIRKIPIDALGLRPDSDKVLKTAAESQGDFNYMNNEESGRVFRKSFERDLNTSIESMQSLMEDPIRLRKFIALSFGEDGMGIDPTTGGGSHLNNLAFFSSLTKDANPMSYSDAIVKNKLYNVFINSLLNGKRSSIELENGIKSNYGGQAYLIQSPNASYRAKPTIVGSDGKMEMRGEMMMSEYERNTSVTNIIKDGKEMRFVDGEKIYTGEELFGKKDWEVIIGTEFDLGTLYDVIEYDKSVGKIDKGVQIGVIVNKKPRTRPNDMMLLGLKGFLPKSYGRAVIVNSLDVVNIFEGDYDADKVDYFYGHSKEMFDHVSRTSNMFVQGVDPSQFKVESKFSWGMESKAIVDNIWDMSSNAVLSKKAIGVVQNIPRKLQYLANLSTKGPEDPALLDKFKGEGRDESPNVLLYTPNPEGGQYRIVVDFDNLDSYTRGTLETQYMIDLAGGVNTELMGNIRNWSDRYLFPTLEESITIGEVKKIGVGFSRENVRKKSNSKRIRIFRKFDKDGNEQETLTDLEKDMIKTLMSEYGKLLNVSGEKTFAKGGENKSLGYEDMYSVADEFFNFNKDLSSSLYYKLRWRKDKGGKPYYNNEQFKAMFNPKSKTYMKGKKEKKQYIPTSDMFDGSGVNIRGNANAIYMGERGSVLERSLRPLWEADVFESRDVKSVLSNSSVTNIMTGQMDSWYQQLMSGEISEYSGSVDAMQNNIMKTIGDYNSAAYYIAKLNKNIIMTENNSNLSYKAKKAIVGKIRETKNTVNDRVRELAPDKYWETYKSKDLTRFTFTPVEGREVKEGIVQNYVIDNLMKSSGNLDEANRKFLQSIKDVRKMFYGNYTNLGEIRKYDEKSVLGRAELDFMRNMSDLTMFYEIENEMLKKGWADHGGPAFILEFMNSPRNPFNIGIKDGQLIPMPYGKTGRYKRGYQFLTKMANERSYDDSRITPMSTLASESKSLLKMLQITEANQRRFMDNKFDMRNLTDPDFTVDIGDGLRFSIENIRIPNFGESLSRVLGDFDSIKWARGTSRTGAGFKPINDNYLSFYSDIMELAGRTDEFKKYMDTMNGLKSDMISNRVINPIEYLATRATIEKDLKAMVSDVLTSGVMEDGNSVLISRIKNNPIYILNGGKSGDGFFSGRSLEPNLQYNIKKLKEVVRISNELESAEDLFRYKTEKSEESIKKYIENCGGS